MAFMGCGDIFYGERDYWPDGSYVTTRWLALFYVPLVPLESLRVREVGFPKTKDYGPITSTSQEYQIHRAGEPHKLQVFSVYAFLVCFVAWMWGLLWTAVKVLHIDKLPNNWDGLAFLVTLLCGVAAAVAVLSTIRKRALRRSIRERARRSRVGV
jgi:hypothetical protein